MKAWPEWVLALAIGISSMAAMFLLAYLIGWRP